MAEEEIKTELDDEVSEEQLQALDKEFDDLAESIETRLKNIETGIKNVRQYMKEMTEKKASNISPLLSDRAITENALDLHSYLIDYTSHFIK